MSSIKKELRGRRQYTAENSPIVYHPHARLWMVGSECIEFGRAALAGQSYNPKQGHHISYFQIEETHPDR
jgi:hypothetical protein